MLFSSKKATIINVLLFFIFSCSNQNKHDSLTIPHSSNPTISNSSEFIYINPLPSSYSNKSTLSLAGYVSNKGQKLLIQGKEVDLKNNGDKKYFETTVPLDHDDVYTFSLEAYFSDTSSEKKQLRIIKDTEKPTITILNAPINHELCSYIPKIEIKDKNLDTDSIKYQLNNNLFVPDTKINTPGTYILRIYAADKAGNSAEVTENFTISDSLYCKSERLSNAYTSSHKEFTRKVLDFLTQPHENPFTQEPLLKHLQSEKSFQELIRTALLNQTNADTTPFQLFTLDILKTVQSQKEFRDRLQKTLASLSSFFKNNKKPLFSHFFLSLYDKKVKENRSIIEELTSVSQEFLGPLYIKDKENIIKNNLPFFLYVLSYRDIKEVSTKLRHVFESTGPIILKILIDSAYKSQPDLNSIRDCILNPRTKSSATSVNALKVLTTNLLFLENTEALSKIITQNFSEIGQKEVYPYIQLILALLDNNYNSSLFTSYGSQISQDKIYSLIENLHSCALYSCSLNTIRNTINSLFGIELEYKVLVPLFTETNKDLTYLLLKSVTEVLTDTKNQRRTEALITSYISLFTHDTSCSTKIITEARKPIDKIAGTDGQALNGIISLYLSAQTDEANAFSWRELITYLSVNNVSSSDLLMRFLDTNVLDSLYTNKMEFIPLIQKAAILFDTIIQSQEFNELHMLLNTNDIIPSVDMLLSFIETHESFKALMDELQQSISANPSPLIAHQDKIRLLLQKNALEKFIIWADSAFEKQIVEDTIEFLLQLEKEGLAVEFFDNLMQKDIHLDKD